MAEDEDTTQNHGYRHQPGTESEFDHHQSWFYNGKESFDQHRTVFMAQINANQANRDADAEQRRRHVEDLHQLHLQHVAETMETTNLAAKAALRNAAVATDRMWNLDEVSNLAASSGVNRAAIGAAVAAAVQEHVAEHHVHSD